jgi:hypothetical protein
LAKVQTIRSMTGSCRNIVKFQVLSRSNPENSDDRKPPAIYRADFVWRLDRNSSGESDFPPSQKVARVESAILLKMLLLSAKHHGWRDILTGDESWFYFPINDDHISLPEEALTPTRLRQTINTPKRMLTIFWSPLGFPFVQLLPKGQHFNAGYFCENILQEINQNRPAAAVEDGEERDETLSSNLTMPPLRLQVRPSAF